MTPAAPDRAGGSAPPGAGIKSPILLAIVVALAAGVVLGIAASTHHSSLEGGSDSPNFIAVARDPFGDGSSIATPEIMGTGYRYGRILYPFVGWLIVGGRPNAVVTGLAIEFAVSLGAAVGLAAWLLQRRGRNPLAALALLLSPFVLLWLPEPAVVAEPTVVAIILGVYIAFETRHEATGRVLAALALLARETTALALLPLIWRDFRHGTTKAKLGWVAAAAPYVGWTIWVRERVGVWPFSDPALSRREALALPVTGIIDGVGRGSDGRLVLSVAIGIGTLALAWVGWRVRSWYPVAAGAALSACVIPFLGPNVWPYPFELSRVLFTTQVLGILVWLGGDPRGAVPATPGRAATATD